MCCFILKLRIRLADRCYIKAINAFGEGNFTKGTKFASRAIRLTPSMCISYGISLQLIRAFNNIRYEEDFFVRSWSKD